MKVHRIILAALAFMLVLGMASAFAEGEGETPAGAQEEFLIYEVVHGGISHPFWKVCQRGAEAADAQFDDLRVVYTGPDVYSFEEFMTIVDAAVAAKPDGLIVTITSPDGMDETLRRVINDLDIPVIAINAKDPRPFLDRIPYLSYVGESSYDVGVAMARQSLLRVPGLRKAVFSNHAPGAIPIEERANGFKDTLEAQGVEVDIVDIGADPVQGASILLDYLKANPDTQLVYPASTPHIEAFIPLAEGEGFIAGKDIFIPSIDISPRILEYIVNGKIMFTLDQQQYMQGYVSVVLMYLHLKYGLTPPDVFPTGPGVITADVVPQLEALSAAGFR